MTSESPTHPDAPRAGGETPTFNVPRLQAALDALAHDVDRDAERYALTDEILTAEMAFAGEIRALAAALPSLLERHRDGERDTKRLDWLERAVPSLEFRDFCNGLSAPWPGTFREFVDAAMMSDPRFNTGDPIMDAALAADDAKLEAMGAYDEDDDGEGYWATDMNGERRWYAHPERESCGGSGYMNCYCGGDLCVCGNQGEIEYVGCPDCEGNDDD